MGFGNRGGGRLVRNMIQSLKEAEFKQMRRDQWA